MRLVIDANLSPVVSEHLRAHGIDATHVVDHGLASASDEDIAEFAAAEAAAVVSADSDFATILALSGKVAPSLVLFRSADALTPNEQAEFLAANLATIEEELTIGAVVSISRRHLRVRRLPLKT